MDFITVASEWLKMQLPSVHQGGESAYNKGSQFLAPAFDRIDKVWSAYAPKLSEKLFKQGFYFGGRLEKAQWTYLIQSDAPKEEDALNQLKKVVQETFLGKQEIEALLKFEKAPPEEGQELFERVKKGFIAEKKHSPTPLNAMIMELFLGCLEVAQRLSGLKAKDASTTQNPSDTKNEPEIKSVDESLSHFERAAIHAGRAYYRRSEHLFHNIGHALRWVLLWKALGGLHPWARKAGFMTGLACAFVNNTKECPQMWKGGVKVPNGLFASTRIVVNRSPRFLQLITLAASALLLWHKSGIPELSPFVSSGLTFFIAGSAGHYVGAPIESMVLKADTPPSEGMTKE